MSKKGTGFEFNWRAISLVLVLLLALLSLMVFKLLKGEVKEKVRRELGKDSAVVVFVPEGRFDEVTKKELVARVINPFVDYYRDLGVWMLTVSVKRAADNSTGYEYTYEGIGKDGVTIGSVITKTNGKFDFFVPECMVECKFSEDFREKYPEVVKLAQ